MKVLLTEDDVVARRLLEAILQRLGHTVLVASSGEEAWRLFQTTPDVDCVVTDWVMPDGDGLELIRRVRATPRPGYVYVIVVTSRGTKADLVEGLGVGADDFLVKPVHADEFGARLRTGERIARLQARLEERNRDLENAYVEISEANRRMREDLEAAARIQQAMLPGTLPRIPGLEFAWRFQPCAELAGDILNVFPLDDDHTAFYLLDVSGHGVPAALMAVALSRSLVPLPEQSSLLMQARPGGEPARPVSPAVVARRLNVRYAATSSRGQFFTLLYGILENATREVTYVSAGHAGALRLRSDGEATRLDATGPPIGIDAGLAFEERKIRLDEGERLCVYSDGLTEARNAAGEQFGVGRLTGTWADVRHLPLGEALTRLMRAVRDWRGRAALEDDASCLALAADGSR